jgi:hypothetical protein
LKLSAEATLLLLDEDHFFPKVDPSKRALLPHLASDKPLCIKQASLVKGGEQDEARSYDGSYARGQHDEGWLISTAPLSGEGGISHQHWGCERRLSLARTVSSGTQLLPTFAFVSP